MGVHILGVVSPHPVRDVNYTGKLPRLEDWKDSLMNGYVGAPIHLEHDTTKPAIGKVDKVYFASSGVVVAEFTIDDSTELGKQVADKIEKGEYKSLSQSYTSHMNWRGDYWNLTAKEVSVCMEGALPGTRIVSLLRKDKSGVQHITWFASGFEVLKNGASQREKFAKYTALEPYAVDISKFHTRDSLNKMATDAATPSKEQFEALMAEKAALEAQVKLSNQKVDELLEMEIKNRALENAKLMHSVEPYLEGTGITKENLQEGLHACFKMGEGGKTIVTLVHSMTKKCTEATSALAAKEVEMSSTKKRPIEEVEVNHSKRTRESVIAEKAETAQERADRKYMDYFNKTYAGMTHAESTATSTMKYSAGGEEEEEEVFDMNKASDAARKEGFAKELK
jgi:hypothetical protein